MLLVVLTVYITLTEHQALHPFILWNIIKDIFLFFIMFEILMYVKRLKPQSQCLSSQQLFINQFSLIDKKIDFYRYELD